MRKIKKPNKGLTYTVVKPPSFCAMAGFQRVSGPVEENV